MSQKHSKEGVFVRADVIRIRAAIASGTPTEVFAKEFGVSSACIRQLATGLTHSDCNDEAPPVILSGKHLKAQKKREQVLAKLAQGQTQADIAREMKMTEGYVSQIARGLR